MTKFVYYTPKFLKIFSISDKHAEHIEVNQYDVTVRGVILEEDKIIYIRINDLSYLESIDPLQAKKKNYQFNHNLRSCESYLKSLYKDFKIYNSYTINELPYSVRRDVLAL